jgi:hypothetical protein
VPAAVEEMVGEGGGGGGGVRGAPGKDVPVEDRGEHGPRGAARSRGRQRLGGEGGERSGAVEMQTPRECARRRTDCKMQMLLQQLLDRAQ